MTANNAAGTDSAAPATAPSSAPAGPRPRCPKSAARPPAIAPVTPAPRFSMPSQGPKSAGACVNIAATSAVMVLLPNGLRGMCISVLVAVIGLVAFGVAPLLVSVAARLPAWGGDLAIPLAAVGLATSLAAVFAFVRAMRVARTLYPGEPA